MVQKLLASTLLLVGLTVVAVPAYGLIAAPPPGPVRFANADAVFVGRVVKIEPAEVEARQFPGAKQTTKYRVAEVEVKEGLLGTKGSKTIRIGFIPPTIAPKGIGPIVSSGGRQPQVQVGQDGLFIINKHHEGKFYLPPNFGYFVPSQQKTFGAEVKSARKIIAVMANPLPVLESQDADDRLLAASLLVNKYRVNRTPGPAKQEPIDAKESKLILNAIANAKWQPVKFGDTNPFQLFSQLGIGMTDGFNAANLRSFDDQRQAVQTWVRAHGDTYRIKRFVTPGEDQ